MLYILQLTTVIICCGSTLQFLQKYRQWCLIHGRKVQSLTDPKRLRTLKARYQVSLVSHIENCYVGIRWWSVHRDGPKEDRHLEFYKGSAAMYFVGTETQLSPLSTDYIPIDEFEAKYARFCRDRNIKMTPLLPLEMEALNIARKRKSIDYFEGLEVSRKNKVQRKVIQEEENVCYKMVPFKYCNPFHVVSSSLEVIADGISYILNSSWKRKCGDFMTSNTILVSLLIFAIILIPLPLYMCVLFMQDSYVAYSGNYYHFEEPGIITWKNVLAPLYLTDQEEGVRSNTIVALANNAMLPHNYFLVYFIIFYVLSGLVTLLCWAFNVVDRSQFLASEEVLLGGTQVSSEQHLDSVIELLLENYNIKCKQRNIFVNTLYIIYTFTVTAIVKLFEIPIRFAIIKCSKETGSRKMSWEQYKTTLEASEVYIFRR